MLDSIHVGVTGLAGYQQGLRVIANNTANLNTPGYKSATLQFADLFHASGGTGGGKQLQVGQGLDTTGTHLDFRQGDLRQTGNDFDLALDGGGLFMLRDEQGRTRFTRAGQFAFDADGAFVNRADGSKVLGKDTSGHTGEITLAGLKTSAGKATTLVRFTGNLSSTVPEQVVGSVKVMDARGGEHTLAAKFTNTDAELAGSWRLDLLDGTTTVGTAQIVFLDGRPTATSAKPSFAYTPAGMPPQQLVLDLSTDVTSFASGSLSTLAMTSQDGYAPGSLSKVSFDAEGALVATYSNGQTAKGARLALSRFSSLDAIEKLGGNMFGAVGEKGWTTGVGGEAGFGSVRAGVLEISNVDLSSEFSELVVMQRGYQASSQVISTANDMLQELFGMKRK
jgi:flagellar hook protein FlgE